MKRNSYWSTKPVRLVSAIALLSVMGGKVSAAEPITILINNSPWYGGFEAVVEEYEAATGNVVNIDRTPYPGVLEKARNAVRGDESPYDLVNLDNPWVVEFYSGGFLTPLTEIDPGFTLPEGTTTNGGMTFWNAEKNWPTEDGGVMMTFSPNANAHLWYYRSDLIDEAPETWDDVFEACAANHNPPDMYGAIQRGERGNPVRFAFMPHMLGHGGSIVRDPQNGDFTVTFNSAENKRALDNFLRLLNECSTANPGAVGQGEMIQSVLTGKAAQAGIVVAAQAQMEDPEKSAVVGQIGFTVMPRPADGKHGPVFGSWQMGVPTNISDARKEAALEFINYFLSEDAQTTYAQGGGIPVNTNVLRGPLSEEPRFRWMLPYAETVESAAQVLQYVEGPQVEQIIGLRLNQAVIGELTATEALNLAAEEIMKVFQDSGRETGMLPMLK